MVRQYLYNVIQASYLPVYIGAISRGEMLNPAVATP